MELKCLEKLHREVTLSPLKRGAEVSRALSVKD